MRSWLSKVQSRHSLSVAVLLMAVVVVVYYPAMLSGILPVDDPGIIALYSSSPRLSQILLPGSGYYYRPLLELSYWLDNLLWGMYPGAMHLENILLHFANSLLVFLLARRVCAGAPEKFPLVPLLAALLFALHPVNVEAVSWIAGRSDLLLTLFVLSACRLWLRWLDEPRWQDVTVAIALFGVSLLAKETALAAGGVALVFALVWPGTATARQRITAIAVMAVPGLLLVVFALLFRSGTSGLSRFAATTPQLGQGVARALTAFGFYAKKLVVPVPLNFAITEVHPGYLLLGAALLPALSWLLFRRRLVGGLFASAALPALPAVLVAVNQIAWTPFAERYLYLPSAFFAVAISALLGSGSSRFKRAAPAALLLVLAVFGCLSMQRTLLWNDKLAFMQDAVAKSPGFGSLYNELGAILAGRGELDRAAAAFATAERLNKRSSMDLLIKCNLLRVRFAKGDFQGVRTMFFQVFPQKKDANADFLEVLQRADGRRLATLSGNDRILLARDILETLDLLNAKRYDAYWLYRSGQISLIAGDKAKAAEFFSRSYTAAPVDAHYKKAAAIYLGQLGRTQ